MNRPRIAGVRAALERVGLPAWFALIDILWIARPDTLGVDARHYQRAASAWLNGGNPWLVEESGFPYASGPHTLLFYVPTNWLPLEAATIVWLAAGVVAAVWLVRRLGLPLWWVLFPPLAHALWNANPQSIMVALLVLGTPAAGAVAAGIKLYALMPLAFHPRRLAVAVLALAVTIVVLPWQQYLNSGLGVGTHVGTAWNGSAWRIPLLVPPTLLALWVLRHRGAEWYAIPAVFPATQFYYVSTALPAIQRLPVATAALALPVPLMTPIVVCVLAAGEVLRARGSGWPGNDRRRVPWSRRQAMTTTGRVDER